MVLNEKQQNAVLFLAFVACISLLCNICLISKYREQKVDLNDPNQQAAASRDTREQPRREPMRAEKTVGRNDPCPCGSGKKFTHCHGTNM